MSEELRTHLDQTNTVAIVTTRPDGTRAATPIWSVVADDGVAYVRSVDGPTAAWYRRAVSGRPVEFSLADGKIAERDPAAALDTPAAAVNLVVIDPDDPAEARVDAALTAKYSSEPPSLAAMLREPAIGSTLRVDPV